MNDTGRRKTGIYEVCRVSVSPDPRNNPRNMTMRVLFWGLLGFSLSSVGFVQPQLERLHMKWECIGLDCHNNPGIVEGEVELWYDTLIYSGYLGRTYGVYLMALQAGERERIREFLQTRAWKMTPEEEWVDLPEFWKGQFVSLEYEIGGQRFGLYCPLDCSERMCMQLDTLWRWLLAREPVRELGERAYIKMRSMMDSIYRARRHLYNTRRHLYNR